MLRGTVVRVNDKVKPKHLKGTVGIAVERITNSGYIKVHSKYEGYITGLCYPEDNLDIIENPIEL
ncbi:unnamed protein product [marine sediment metagenome]|uniref:Uncharacterized protein n=1 Tax=marine sediment metagenome TaxID=412755 RepID=X1VEQ8_9ZZZZ